MNVVGGVGGGGWSAAGEGERGEGGSVEREVREKRFLEVDDDGGRYGGEVERGKRLGKEGVVSKLLLCSSPCSYFPHTLLPHPGTIE
jgi:hypothetical protein